MVLICMFSMTVLFNKEVVATNMMRSPTCIFFILSQCFSNIIRVCGLNQAVCWPKRIEKHLVMY